MTDADLPLVHLPGERERAPGLRRAAAGLPADGPVEALGGMRA